MQPRKIFRWTVQLQDGTGAVTEEQFTSYWSPARDFITTESVAAACAVQKFLSGGKKVPVVGISAVLVS